MGGLALAWAPSIPFLHFGSLCGVFKFCLTLNSISTWPQLLMLSPAALLTFKPKLDRTLVLKELLTEGHLSPLLCALASKTLLDTHVTQLFKHFSAGLNSYKVLVFQLDFLHSYDFFC